MPVLIDTDIGTDADDAMALVYAVRSGMDIVLVSTVHGDTGLRAAIAKKFLHLLGSTVPVVAGERKPLKQPTVYWTGIEGNGFVDTEWRGRIDGVEAIAETIRAHEGIDIAAIGPLTNIAKTFQQYPDLAAKVRHLYMMGNAVQCGDHLHLNYRAHNFKADPEAADIVMASAVPKTIITTEVSKQLPLDVEELERLRDTGNPTLQYIHDSAKAWMHYVGYTTAFLYDPLVVAHCGDGNITTRKIYGNVAVTAAVDPTFKGRFLEIILREVTR